MKTSEELRALKEEYTSFNAKLMELSAEEMAQVAGGFDDEDNLMRPDPYKRFRAIMLAIQSGHDRKAQEMYIREKPFLTWEELTTIREAFYGHFGYPIEHD